MKQIFLDKPLTEDEYILFEEGNLLKHEYINGKLFEMSGSSKYHNAIERRFANLIEKLLGNNGYEVFTEGYKVKSRSYFFISKKKTANGKLKPIQAKVILSAYPN
ncbi:MAG TPA: Uma2 family endonuclease [Chitinophagaceae bacterium]|nr:Uma2 family endonuclease [Chitinophagaceae bacterium]